MASITSSSPTILPISFPKTLYSLHRSRSQAISRRVALTTIVFASVFSPETPGRTSSAVTTEKYLQNENMYI
ncbi:hypothetical protein Hanom_Chr11g01017131 [Helianthus anomalus]